MPDEGLEGDVPPHRGAFRDEPAVAGLVGFGKLDLRSTSGRLLVSLAGQILAGDSAQTAADEGSALQEALIALLLPTLRGSDLGDAPHAALLRDQAQRLIDQLLQEEQLSPQYLAERLHISIRQLYRLFEDSVCRYIQRQRLQRSAEDLGNPQLRRESITQIAFKWGFADSAHFSRAVRAIAQGLSGPAPDGALNRYPGRE